MSNPPPPGNPSPWARPGQHGPGQPGANPSPPHHQPSPDESSTRRMPAEGHRPDQPTTRIPGYPAGPPPHPVQAGPPEQAEPAKQAAPPAEPSAGEAEKPKERHDKGFLRDPLALTLTAITVVALLLAGMVGAELIARGIADRKVAKATECVVEDSADVSFGVWPPFLIQHITGDYTNISIRTAGHQVKKAKEMKVDIEVFDVRLHPEAASAGRGTIGALDATITWPTVGIKDTVRSMIPLFGDAISDVSTNAGDGTVSLQGPFGLGGVTVKPEAADGRLSLKVEKLTGLGSMALPREIVQPALDEFISKLTSDYPLGLRADSVQVTDSGVIAKFSTRNATIPSHAEDPCFAEL